MNNNRSHDYENYMNSYGMQEIQREAKNAQMLKEAGSNASSSMKLAVWVGRRLAPVAIVVAILIILGLFG